MGPGSSEAVKEHLSTDNHSLPPHELLPNRQKVSSCWREGSCPLVPRAQVKTCYGWEKERKSTFHHLRGAIKPSHVLIKASQHEAGARHPTPLRLPNIQVIAGLFQGERESNQESCTTENQAHTSPRDTEIRLQERANLPSPLSL